TSLGGGGGGCGVPASALACARAAPAARSRAQPKLPPRSKRMAASILTVDCRLSTVNFPPMRRLALRLDPIAYAIWAAAWTIASAHAFYRSMAMQTGGEWSAPLDDVFIHFDFARATALGHPFEWVPGNGYSSG